MSLMNENQDFFNKTNQGKNSWIRYIFGLILIVFSWRIVGGLFFYFMQVWPQGLSGTDNLFIIQEKHLKTFSMYPLWSYVSMHIPFIIGLATLIIIVKYIHFRKLKSLFSVGNFKFKRFFYSLGVIFTITSVGWVINYLISPKAFSLNQSQSLLSWLPFFALVIILTGVQIVLEELFFRSYLMQMMVTKTRSVWLASLISVILFGVMHLYLPEASQGFLAVLNYFIFGVVATYLVILEGGLEAVLPFHFVLNMWYASVFSYQNGTYPINGLVLIDYSKIDPVASIVVGFMPFILYPLIIWSASKIRLLARISGK